MSKIKDSKIGRWLKEKAPNVLDKVGDLLPTNGVLGIIKNLISTDPQIPQEQKLEYYRLQTEFEIELVKAQQLELASARTRESDFIKATGHADWFMWVFGALLIGVYVFTVIISAYGEIPEDMREMFIESKTSARDIVLMIAGYYWGSSLSSRIKDMRK